MKFCEKRANLVVRTMTSSSWDYFFDQANFSNTLSTGV